MTDRLMLELDYPQVWSKVPACRYSAKRLVKRAYQSYRRYLPYACCVNALEVHACSWLPAHDHNYTTGISGRSSSISPDEGSNPFLPHWMGIELWQGA